MIRKSGGPKAEHMAKHIVRSRVTYILLLWHFVLWCVLAGTAPVYRTQFLYVCLASYLGLAALFFYREREELRGPAGEDKVLSPAFQIASETLPFLRTGLNEMTAPKVAEIIKEISDVSAVAITDRVNVLAFIGPGCEHHPPGKPIVTQATLKVIASGELRIVSSKSEFDCPRKDCNCPLESAVIAPLKYKDTVAGTVKLYQTQKGRIPDYVIKLAQGMAQLLSMQIELAELDYQTHLAVEAKLDALQAQINPHFLFNSLNTIAILIRTNPELARTLVYRFASSFRYSLGEKGRFVTLREEMKFVQNYSILEKARFRKKLKIIKRIDREAMEQVIPILSVQPLLENAIRHGITPKEGPGTVRITARMRNTGEMEITVSDDGVGISPEALSRVLKKGPGSGGGVGLNNVNERLKMLYGEEYGLKIKSEPGSGTEVAFIIPGKSGQTGKEQRV